MTVVATHPGIVAVHDVGGASVPAPHRELERA